MSRPSIDDEVRRFYSGHRLSEERVVAILDASTLAAAAQRWKRAAIMTSLACAAMTLLAFGLWLRSPQNHVAEAEPKLNSQPIVADEPRTKPLLPTAMNADPLTSSRVQPQFRFVAFRSHTDGCPHCKATAEVYAEVTKELTGHTQRLEFEQFDLSSESADVTLQRLADQRLLPLVDGRIESAFLALVDHDGNLLQEFKPSMKSQRIAAAVRNLMTE